MSDYYNDILKLTSGIRDIVDIQIMEKLHYSKYAFVVESSFDDFNRKISAHVASKFSSKGNLISFIKESASLLKNIYGNDWEKYEYIHLCKKFKPDQYDKFLEYISILKNMNISKSLFNKYSYKSNLVTIKIPKDHTHLQELLELQQKTDNDKSFIKIKYRSGEPYDKEYPVKSVVNLSGKGLSTSEVDFLVETFETTEGIKMVSKNLRSKLSGRWPVSTTIYAKSPECFGHFVFMLKPYNIKFLRTEVYE
jgi:hypothetical protein